MNDSVNDVIMTKTECSEFLDSLETRLRIIRNSLIAAREEPSRDEANKIYEALFNDFSLCSTYLDEVDNQVTWLAKIAIRNIPDTETVEE